MKPDKKPRTPAKELARHMVFRAAKSVPAQILAKWRLRSLVKKHVGSVYLHLGCGPRQLPGWINVDVMPIPRVPDVVLDLERGIPLPDSSVDLIFTEDMIEHLSYNGGRRLVAECARILKPGGVVRIGTPDLRSFIRAYWDRAEADLVWYQQEFEIETFAEMFNAGMRAWGHSFIFDEETLSLLLQKHGLIVSRHDFGESQAKLMRGLDLRSTSEGAHSMFLEGLKPRLSHQATGRAAHSTPVRI